MILHNKKPIIWSISGSDCSGGAGIAADIKTGHALGVEVCHLITANTVQNARQLVSINPQPIALLQAQLAILQADKPAAVIKIGLVANLAQVHWLCASLTALKQQNTSLICVYDPVGQASVGGSLSTLTLAQLAPLLSLVDIITPNLIEARYLADQQASACCFDKLSLGKNEPKTQQQITPNEVAFLAKKIFADFAIKTIIIKGGHSADNRERCIDYCFHQLNQLRQDNPLTSENSGNNQCYQLSSPRLNSHYSHGGGCSFASAIAAFLAHGYLVRDAFTLSKAFINQGLAATRQVSANQQDQYYGAFEQLAWPNNPFDFPQVITAMTRQNQQQKPSLKPFPSLNLAGEKLGLYPVVDSLYWLKRLLPLGLHIIQLRIKNLAAEQLEATIINALNLAKHYKTRLFINDYWQLAIKHGAYGVHIGQEDLAQADLMAIQKAGLRLGISTHGCYEWLLGQQLKPSYLAIGAIFSTKTKDMRGQIQGINNLKQLLALQPNQQQEKIPVVAIGGITLVNAPQVAATGVDSIAVVTAISQAKQAEQAVAAFKQLMASG